MTWMKWPQCHLNRESYAWASSDQDNDDLDDVKNDLLTWLVELSKRTHLKILILDATISYENILYEVHE